MTEKSKRKVNPRRRTLIRLLLGITIFAALISAGIYVLRPKSAQIVFIAPDDSGVDNLWIADLNDPENPRQVTHQNDGNIISLWASNQDNTIIFEWGIHLTGVRSLVYKVWLLDINSKQTIELLNCEDTPTGCPRISVHPSGQWLTYTEAEIIEGRRSIHRYLHNTLTSEVRLVQTQELNNILHPEIKEEPLWLGDDDMLVYRIPSDSDLDEYAFYSISEERIVAFQSLHIPIASYPTFSPDGSGFIHYTPNYESISFRELANTDEAIFTLETQNIQWSATVGFNDWHPDNQQVLIHRRWRHNTSDSSHYELSLVNITTHEMQTLILDDRHLIDMARFNYDGSQIVFRRYDFSNQVSQIMIYNMETREEIALPLFGFNPQSQWVNGGRS